MEFLNATIVDAHTAGPVSCYNRFRSDSGVDAGPHAAADLYTASLVEPRGDGGECGLSHSHARSDAHDSGCGWAGYDLACLVHAQRRRAVQPEADRAADVLGRRGVAERGDTDRGFLWPGQRHLLRLAVGGAVRRARQISKL